MIVGIAFPLLATPALASWLNVLLIGLALAAVLNPSIIFGNYNASVFFPPVYLFDI